MLTKEDAKMSQGLAIIAMVTLHLFCRRDVDLYNVHVFIGNTPLLYYIGLFGDICVPIYCFSSGYAQMVLYKKEENYRNKRIKRLKRFIFHFWLVVVLFSFIGLMIGNKEIPGDLMTFLGNISLLRMNYNGAWWFVLTYVFLILLSPTLINIVEKNNYLVCFLVSGIIYFVSYVFRFVL